MYAREINGTVHTFGVSGKLIMNALVMYDHQTRTLWSQFLGEGVKGPQTGVKLDFLPVTHTQWSLWRELQPNTLVLDKGGRYQYDVYDSYYVGGSTGVLGEARVDSRLRSKELVVGVEYGGHTKAYSLNELRDQLVVNDTLAGEGFVVYLDGNTDTAVVFKRKVKGRLLTFRLEEEGAGPQARLVDDETGTEWVALTGRAAEGPLKGERLTRASSHISFWFAWKDWNPDTDVYEPTS